MYYPVLCLDDGLVMVSVLFVLVLVSFQLFQSLSAMGPREQIRAWPGGVLPIQDQSQSSGMISYCGIGSGIAYGNKLLIVCVECGTSIEVHKIVNFMANFWPIFLFVFNTSGKTIILSFI